MRKPLVALFFATALHAGMTCALLVSYIGYAMDVSHGLREPTVIGEYLQYLKGAFLWPILLPLFKFRADLVAGVNGFFFLLFNSSIWVFVGWVVIRRFQKGRQGSVSNSPSEFSH